MSLFTTALTDYHILFSLSRTFLIYFSTFRISSSQVVFESFTRISCLSAFVNNFSILICCQSQTAVLSRLVSRDSLYILSYCISHCQDVFYILLMHCFLYQSGNYSSIYSRSRNITSKSANGERGI